MEYEFQPGDVVMWDDEEFVVVSNSGDHGQVCDGAGMRIKMRWVFGNMRVTLVRKATA